MRVKFLGTGDAGGVPLYGCECALCHRARSVASLRRQPTSALLSSGTTTIAIDAGRPDLADLVTTGDVRAICLTHFHVDHVAGLFRLRWGINDHIVVHCPDDPAGCADLYKHPGVLDFQAHAPWQEFRIGSIAITTLPLTHSKPSLGYLFRAQGKTLAWLCDTGELDDATLARLSEESIDLAVVDATHPPRREPDRNHNDLDGALGLIAACGARRGLLVHLGHLAARHLEEAAGALPRGVEAARDGAHYAVA